jgi:hypothetical protein
MSLLKLLSAAKSLDGSKPMPSPYKMKSARFLPKFGSPKNPFARAKSDSAKPASDRLETGSLFGDEPKAEPAAPAPIPAAKAPVAKETKPIVEPEKKIEAKPANAAPAAAAPTAKAPKSAGVAEFIKKLNPLKHLPKRRPEARPARPKVARAAQGELSLEKVRPLRNELNDSDLEFVATPKLVSTGTAGSTLLASRTPKMTTWGRLTSRVIGAVETQTQ